METLMKTHGNLATEIRRLEGGDEKRLQRLWRLKRADLAALKAIYAYRCNNHMLRLVKQALKDELEAAG